LPWSTLAFQFLSMILVRSTSFIFSPFWSFSHLILSTITSSSSYSTSSCSIGFSIGSFSNYFLMNDWSSISHFNCSAVGSTFLCCFASVLYRNFSSKMLVYLTAFWGFDSACKKLTAKFCFSFSISCFCNSLVSAILIGFQFFKSSSSCSPLPLLAVLKGNFLIILLGSALGASWKGSFYSSFPIL
jgi:hypothetical protein